MQKVPPQRAENFLVIITDQTIGVQPNEQTMHKVVLCIATPFSNPCLSSTMAHTAFLRKT
jgi:hypothetical protein